MSVSKLTGSAFFDAAGPVGIMLDYVGEDRHCLRGLLDETGTASKCSELAATRLLSIISPKYQLKDGSVTEQAIAEWDRIQKNIFSCKFSATKLDKCAGRFFCATPLGAGAFAYLGQNNQNSLVLSTMAEGGEKYTCRGLQLGGGPFSGIVSFAHMGGNEFILGTTSKKIRVCQIDRGSEHQCTQELDSDKMPMLLMQLGDHSFLSGGTYDNCARVWKREQNKYQCTQTLDMPLNSFPMAFPLEQNTFAFLGKDERSIRIYAQKDDKSLYQHTNTLTGFQGSISCLSPLGERSFATAESDMGIKIWQLKSPGDYSCTQTIGNLPRTINGLFPTERDGLVFGGGQTLSVLKKESNGQYKLSSSHTTSSTIRGLMGLSNDRWLLGTCSGTLDPIELSVLDFAAPNDK